MGIVPRPGSASAVPVGWRGYEIAMEPVDLSSTYVRELDPKDPRLEKLLPAGVIPLLVGA